MENRKKVTNKNIIIGAVIVIAFLAGLGSGYLLWHRSFPMGGFKRTQVNASKMVGTQFSSFPFASSSYLISGNATLSASGKIATEDFNTTTKQLANGSTLYSLKFDELGTVYNVTIAKGDKLYYIDTNLADDAPGSDMSIGDDGYAVVNSTGYITIFKYPLPNT